MAAPTQLGEHIEFINDQEKQYFAEAMVGEEVLSFLNSTTGMYLHGCAKRTYQKCLEELFELDPFTAEGKKEHARLQREAWCAEQFMKWCKEAIETGRDAAVQLESYRDDLGED
jgi:hypothetical protein